MGARAQTFVAELKKGSQGKRGRVIIRAETLVTSNLECNWVLEGTNLANYDGGCMGMCAEVAPVHWNLLRATGADVTESSQFNTTFNSEVVQNTNNPRFRPRKFSLT